MICKISKMVWRNYLRYLRCLAGLILAATRLHKMTLFCGWQNETKAQFPSASFVRSF